MNHRLAGRVVSERFAPSTVIVERVTLMCTCGFEVEQAAYTYAHSLLEAHVNTANADQAGEYDA